MGGKSSREYFRAYRAKNGVRLRAAAKAYREANRDKTRRWAREHQRKKQKVWHAWIDAIKTTAGCKDCGYDKHPAALDFDHLPGCTKLFVVSRGCCLPRERVLAEIAKCEVICANCHRIRTWQRKQPIIESKAREMGKVA